MSVWFEQKVSAIGPDDGSPVANLLTVEVGHKATDWSIGTVHLSASMKNAPPFNLTKMSKKHPEVIFAVSSFCDTGGSYYRFLLLNGKHMPIDTVEDVFSSSIGSHYEWADRLSYKQTLKLIEEFDYKDTLGHPVPINEDTEIGFLEPVIEIHN